jgi:hypothetical protein
MTFGLVRGIIEGKAFFNESDKPQFIEALIPISFFRPSVIKCSLLSIISTACLNKINPAQPRSGVLDCPAARGWSAFF